MSDRNYRRTERKVITFDGDSVTPAGRGFSPAGSEVGVAESTLACAEFVGAGGCVVGWDCAGGAAVETGGG